ncbi:charged multivesicular body protein 4c isoform X2 [Monomorium pharaonis]|nr:charged multivesicular body protein 4c isoform X2 [Monomorium pharaonis]
MQDLFQAKIDAEMSIARKNYSENKEVAIFALKKMKGSLQQLQRYNGILSKIKMQREALEYANTNIAVFTMKNVVDAMKAAHQHMDVDREVHDMINDIAEQQDVARKISEAIPNPVTFSQNADENELERELEELQLDKELLGIDKTTNELPAVPTAVSVAPSKTYTKAKPEENDDLKELKAWAS